MKRKKRGNLIVLLLVVKRGVKFWVVGKVVVSHNIIAVYLTGMCPTDMRDILARPIRPNSLCNRYIGRYYRCTDHLCIGTRAQHKELQFLNKDLIIFLTDVQIKKNRIFGTENGFDWFWREERRI